MKMNGSIDPLNTARHVPHIKMILQPSSSNAAEDEVEWLVLTSHNLSISAWGQIQKSNEGQSLMEEKVLFIRHWELGVFLSPATLNAGGIAALPRPSAGEKCCMRPYCGIASSSNAVINVDSDDDEDENPNNVLFLPIPFDLNPDPYDNDDIAWACDRSCLIPDAFGCILR